MKIPRWVSVVALLSSSALLFGCGLAGSGSSGKSGSLSITTAALPDATVSQTYSDTLQASGGTTPYSWNVIGGTMPTGLSMKTSGQITGTPTEMGSYTFQAQVTDASKHSSSSNFSMKVTGPAPSISGISPSYGSTSGGTSVTISGKNIRSGATVTFGGVAGTSANVVNSGQMTAVTPAHAAGSVDVVVTNPGGKSATLAAAFNYGNAAPTVSAISPNSGPATGGTTVTITGTNFVVGAAVLFGSAQASSVAVTAPTQIQAVSPAGTAGSVDVTVKNTDGHTGTLAGGFTYSSDPSGSPSISGLSPNSGPADTNTLVKGSNFVSGATVSFGGTQASSVTFVSSSQLSVVVPSIPAGTYDVTVNNTGGASGSLASGFTVVTPQSLLSGCTVDASNNPSCAIPSGWVLVTAQGFDAGSLPSSQTTAGTIESSFAHTGSHALVGNYSGGDQSYGWYLNGSTIGSTDVYWSWWEYDESQGKLNQDFMMSDRRLNDSSGNRLINAYVDIVAGGCLFNCTQQPISLFADPYWSHYGPNTDPGWGAWTQWEVHMNNGSGTTTDGDVEIYRDGTLLFSATGLNYHYDMTNANLSIGGVYTYLVWWLDSAHTQCASGHSSYTTNYSDWTKPDPCPNQAPPNGYGIPFKRYFDDIILIKK